MKNKRLARKSLKTKIVATLGPATDNEKVLTDMLRAGVTVARVNFSHGTHEANGALIDAVRSVSQKTGQPVAVLQDLCGPKIRIGDFITETVTLKPKDTFTLTTKKVVGTDAIVSVTYKHLPKEVKVGSKVLINDGKLLLKVMKTTDTDIVCRVLNGGTIRSRRGVNVPGSLLSISAMTPKDKKDLAFGLKKDIDFVTLSFVRRAKDIVQLRKLLGKKADRVHIVAKIETQAAIENIDEIIKVSDAIMVARGDLAIEIPRAQVPLVQKHIINKCNHAGVPVITATQMLDSMREQEVPTRAEVNDVANAVLDGSDAVMLSDETAIGQYPVTAVKVMAEVAHTVESERSHGEIAEAYFEEGDRVTNSVTNAIVHEAERLKASAIVALTESGRTARLIARHRPRQMVYMLTSHDRTLKLGLLLHGCVPIMIKPIGSLDDANKEIRRLFKKYRVAKPNDLFILGIGRPYGKTGSTNMMVVDRV